MNGARDRSCLTEVCVGHQCCGSRNGWLENVEFKGYTAGMRIRVVGARLVRCHAVLVGSLNGLSRCSI